MSREFGSYETGYFHTQIETAAEDCEAGRDEMTRAWGKVLKAFSPIAWAIASSEACDASEADTILATIENLPAFDAALGEIKSKIDKYRDLVRNAFRAGLKP